MSKRPTGSYPGRPSFEQACAMYVHRYTAEHVPGWARGTPTNGKFYAPQFASDREWYEHTLFPGETEHFGPRDSCFTTGQTWPYGQWLDEPYRPDDRPAKPAPSGPIVGITFGVNGNDYGYEVAGLDEAARCTATWIRGINPADVGVDFRITIEILDPTEES